MEYGGRRCHGKNWGDAQKTDARRTRGEHKRGKWGRLGILNGISRRLDLSAEKGRKGIRRQSGDGGHKKNKGNRAEHLSGRWRGFWLAKKEETNSPEGHGNTFRDEVN